MVALNLHGPADRVAFGHEPFARKDQGRAGGGRDRKNRQQKRPIAAHKCRRL
jgi:hypothetical protein